MSARILDGRAAARAVRARVAEGTARLVARHGVTPGLAVVLVGEDPASQVYVKNKDRAAAQAGFGVRTVRLPEETSEGDLLGRVLELGADPSVHGVLVQLPLPPAIDATRIVRAIPPAKDVDGLHPDNVAALATGQPGLFPCTPLGCLELCDQNGIALEGARAVIVGRSLLVGKPLLLLLLGRNATVTVCHSRTRDLPAVCREADLLVAAVGRAELVRADWVRPGAAVLDVGINRVDGRGLVGDVAFEEVSQRAGWITPVPGGVGPMTIAMLLANTLRAACRACGIEPEALVG